MANYILKISFLFVSVLLLNNAVFASSISVDDFASNGKFYFPEKVNNGSGKIEYLNDSTIEYIVIKALWGKNAKDVLGIYFGDYRNKKFLYVIDRLEDLISDNKLPSKSEWPIEARHLEYALDGKKYPPDQGDNKPLVRNNEGFSFKGVRLRDQYKNWKKNLNQSRGANFSYFEDGISTTDTFFGKGALILPLARSENEVGLSENIQFFPFIEWDIKDISEEDKNDKESLKIGFGINKYTIFDKSNFFTSVNYSLAPYYLSDLDLKGEVLGIDFNLTPRFNLLGVEFGAYRHVVENGLFAYKLEVSPSLTFSRVNETSQFIDRPKGDESLAFGGTFELALRPLGFESKWEILSSYTYSKDTKSSSDEDTKLFRLETKYWVNKNFAISIETQEGDEPITNKDIDQNNFGIELRF